MNHDDDYDLIFKIVIIGDSGVGKTNIFSRYLRNEFKIDTKATVGVEFGSQRIVINDTKIKAQIWDTAGQERYRSVTNAYYKGSKGAMVVYDVTKIETFENIDRWITDLKKNADANISIILVGNKCDLENQRMVGAQQGESKAKAFDIPFLETSAYTAVNIEKAFNVMISEIFKKHQKNSNDGIDEFELLHRNTLDLCRESNLLPKKENSVQNKKFLCC